MTLYLPEPGKRPLSSSCQRLLLHHFSWEEPARELTISAEEGKGAKQNGLQRVSGPPPTRGLHSEGPEHGFMGGWIDVWKQECVLMPLHKKVRQRELPGRITG